MKYWILFMLVSLAAAQCPPTSGAAISACGGATGPVCGFPGYACARSDANAQLFTSMTTIPPSAGANTCTAGMDGHLQGCGNLNGTNTVITDANYNNARIVRISDYTDAVAGCSPFVGQGGSAAYSVFDTSDTYLLVSCGGNTQMKWLNPSTMLVNFSVDPQGYVHTASGVWSVLTAQVRASHATAGLFYIVNGTQAQSFTVASGVAAAPVTFVDFSYAVPCWGNIGTACPNWAASTNYAAGQNLMPVNGSGHNFQTLNGVGCTSGGTEPNWAATIALATSTAQGVVTDGTCQWADMWIPTSAPAWAAGFSSDRTDHIFNLGMSNHGQQDGAGACFETSYILNSHTYYHLNTCTGNVYSTSCSGTTYNCSAGGTWTRSYLGNVYTDNPWTGGRNSRIDMHSTFMSLNGVWTDIGLNNCALVNSSGPVNCAATVTNDYYWIIGSNRMLNAFDWLSTGTPGHAVPGANVLAYKNQSTYNSHAYLGYSIPASGVTGGTAYQWFDLSQFTCSPNSCWQRYSLTNPTMSQTFVWDQHSSWQSNQGGDNTPICTETYTQPGPQGGQPVAQVGLFPPVPGYAWLGEVLCYATDGSNHVAREAFNWNTQSSSDFNATFSIGSLSGDGKWWAFNSDWFCTLGNKSGSTVNLCALPIQAGHAYAVGEYVAAPLYNPPVSAIYQVIVAGTADNVQHGQAYWAACSSGNCTLSPTTDTLQLNFLGAPTQLNSVFVVGLQ